MSGRGAGLSSLLLRLIFLVVGEGGGGGERDSPNPSLYKVCVLNTLFYFQYLIYFHENYV